MVEREGVQSSGHPGNRCLQYEQEEGEIVLQEGKDGWWSRGGEKRSQSSWEGGERERRRSQLSVSSQVEPAGSTYIQADRLLNESVYTRCKL